MSALTEPTLYARADALKLDAPIPGLPTVPAIPLQNATERDASTDAIVTEIPNLSAVKSKPKTASKPKTTPKAKPAPKSPTPEESDDDEEYDDARSVDSSDEGSLVDFIVKECGEEGEDEEPGSEDDDTPLSKEEEMKRDLDGIDKSNIVLGKRTRRATVRYEETVFGSQEYKKMMLCDVPDSEMHALEDDSDDESVEDEEDEEYESEGEEEEEEEEEEDA